MKRIIPYVGTNDITFDLSFSEALNKLKEQKKKINTEHWPNKKCTPEVPWDIIRIDNSISLFFAKGKMFKMYFENNFDGALKNGIHLGMSIDEAKMIDPSLQYDDWEEEYTSTEGYWLEDDTESHTVASITIYIKAVENDSLFYSYKWCNN